MLKQSLCGLFLKVELKPRMISLIVLPFIVRTGQRVEEICIFLARFELVRIGFTGPMLRQTVAFSDVLDISLFSESGKLLTEARQGEY